MVRKSAIQFRRYMFDSLGGLLSLYLVFVLLFYGARAILPGGQSSSKTLSALVVGYAVWMLSIFAYSGGGFELQEEATAGTLEQLAMSPYGLPAVLLTKFVAGLLFALVEFVVVVALNMATSGRWLHVDVVSVVPLVLLTVAGVMGVGFMSGGLALVFKRIQSITQILQFVFVALIVAPLDRIPAVKFLPLSWGNHLIRRVMVDGVRLWDMPMGDVGFLLVHAAAWLGAGMIAFAALERVARDRALLGQY
jgi:ABC-2 type transport system permease protein